MADKESNFRIVLTDLQSALDGAVRLQVNNDYTADLVPLFDGLHPWRSFLPEFSGNNFVLGTLDPTFAGVLSGLDLGTAESFISQRFPAVPDFDSAGAVQNQFVVQLNVLPGQGYAIESSTDLVDWTAVLHEFATNTVLTLADPDSAGPRRFYRARQESNDRFTNAYVISGFPAVAFGSNQGATSEPGGPTNYFNQNSGTGTPVWWVWTAPASGEVGVSAAGTGFRATVLGVFTGSSLADLVPVPNLANGSFRNEFDLQATAGTTYFIAVESGFYYQQGNITVTIAGPPANDNFANRQTLAGASVSVNGSYILASEEPNEPSSSGHSVWYSWTAPAAGSVTLSTAGPAYLKVSVFTGNTLATLVQMPNVQYSNSGITFDAVAGATYQIQIDGYYIGYTGNFTLGLTLYAGRYPLFLSAYPAEGGSIVLQPPPDTNGMYAAGTTVTMTAQPAEGWVFSGWSGTQTGTNSMLPVVMDRIQSLQAAFSPANDHFADAIVLTGASATVNGTTLGEAWYSWTAPASGSVTFWFESANGAYMHITTGNQPANLIPVSIFSYGGSHGVSSETFDAVAGTTYQINISNNEFWSSNDSVLLLNLSEGFYALSESVAPTQGGSISVNPPASTNGLYAAGTTVSLTAQPAPGWLFSGWSGTQTGTNSTLPVVMDGSQSVQALFSPPGAYTFTTLAGSAGSQGSADGTGSAAHFNGPYGVAVDSAGNVYAADTDNNTIRRVTPAGAVTTLAGLAGSSGSADGTGSGARFNFPFGVAVDSAGNVYVADTDNHTIRRVTPAGVVTTLAGLAGSWGSADGTGSGARFSQPSGVAVDSTGNIYVADTNNHTIRKVTPAGVVTTLAGLAGNWGSADGMGSVARFNYPAGAAVDSADNLYVADSGNNTIRKGSP